MSKLKFLTILSVALTVINLILIGFILLKPHHGKNKNAPKEYIIKQLQLDEEQIVQYEKLIIDHQKERIALNAKIIAFRKQLYPTVLKQNNASKEAQILLEMNGVHQALELVHLNHFKELKKICRTDQVEYFDVLVDELTNLFVAKRHKNKD